MPDHRYRLPVTDADREVRAALLLAAGARGIEERADALEAWFDLPTDDVPPGGSWDRPEPHDWLAEVAATLAPVRVGPFLLVPDTGDIDPTVDGPGDDGAAAVRIVLDGAHAFGTGHHPTTAGCLEVLATLDLAGRRVVDVGCGTGVLAIAAARSGAEVVAIDIDPRAVAVARANAVRNGVAIDVREGDVAAAPHADVVVANLVTDTLVANAAALVDRCDGVLVASGVATPRVPRARAALEAAGLTVDRVVEQGGWAVLVGHRTPCGAAALARPAAAMGGARPADRSGPRGPVGASSRRATRGVGAALALALLTSGCGSAVPDPPTEAADAGAGAGAATQPEAPDPTGAALLAQLDRMEATVLAAQTGLRDAAGAATPVAARDGARAALALLVVGGADRIVDGPPEGLTPLLPATAAAREGGVTAADLLTATVTVAGDDGSERGRVVLELLRDPIAGDLGAWQRDPGGVIALVRATVAEGVAAGDDVETLDLRLRELPGQATRALGWAIAVLDARDLATAQACAARGAAHLEVVLVGLTLAREAITTPASAPSTDPTTDGTTDGASS